MKEVDKGERAGTCVRFGPSVRVNDGGPSSKDIMMSECIIEL